jgi:hypothetical protein
VVSNLSQFNTSTCLCLLQTTICISIGIRRNRLCIQWFGIVCFVDISGIVGYHCLNFPFIIYHTYFLIIKQELCMQTERMD